MLQVDRPVDKRINKSKALKILMTVFTKIMPKYGFNIRDEQIDLAEHILDILERRGITLAEAEVGTGKTLAYLIAAIFIKLGRINDSHNMSIYPEMSYKDMQKMPIVVATSSIALQKAIITEYIPQLSKILLENGVITKPITAVLRKGRENYICQRKLKTYMSSVADRAERQILEQLFDSNAFDFAEVGEFEITPKIKKSLSVSGRCFDTCPNRDKCRYQEYMEQAQSPDTDIFVLNQNLLLADTIRRADNKQALIPNYQMLIIDEAHKLLSVARSMYGVELSSEASTELIEKVYDITDMLNAQNSTVIFFG